MPAGYTGATNAARLLSFFSLSDIHLTDKESPAQIPEFGGTRALAQAGFSRPAYSPIMRSTTHVLDAAVKTVNDLHQQTPFDFGLVLVMWPIAISLMNSDGSLMLWTDSRITPSSGAHLGATPLIIRNPIRPPDLTVPSLGMRSSATMTSLDGCRFPTDKVRQTLVGSTVLNMAPNPLGEMPRREPACTWALWWTTRYGDAIKGGPANLFATPPTVAADPNATLSRRPPLRLPFPARIT